MDNLPKAVWTGKLNVFGLELNCAVLDDGRRVIDAEDVQRFCLAMENGFPEPDNTEGIENFAQFIKAG